mgnify:CR=1 FL=1
MLPQGRFRRRQDRKTHRSAYCLEPLWQAIGSWFLHRINLDKAVYPALHMDKGRFRRRQDRKTHRSRNVFFETSS